VAATVSSPGVSAPSRARTRVRIALRDRARTASRAVRLVWKHAIRAAGRLARFGDVTLARGVRLLKRTTAATLRRVDTVRPTLAHTANLIYYHQADELRQCPACQSNRLSLLAPMPLNARPRGQRYGFITGCRSCGLLFANPLPTAERLRAFYAPGGEWETARHEEAPRTKASAAAYVLELFAPTRAWLDPERPVPGAAVFEFGCGDGELLDALQTFGWSTSGLDPADKRAFTRHRELREIPTEPLFDVIIVHHVLEHVATPLTILRALHRALKPGGLVLVSVPRLDTLYRHRDLRYCINPRTHIVAYSRDCLATLFALSGFEPIDGSPPSDAAGADWFVLRRLRMIGRKTDAPVAAPAHPLRAARRALAAFYAHQATPHGWRARLPVRARAALAEVNRSRAG
jgi:SAM-dependent methyltransferase